MPLPLSYAFWNITFQVLYFTSFIFRVLTDVDVIPKTQVSVYTITIINIALFVYCGYRVFIYLQLYQGVRGFKLWNNNRLYGIPCLFNMVLLFLCPLTGVFFSAAGDGTVTSGPLSALQWRIPILPIGLIFADIFVYIHYTDILMRERNQSMERERNLALKQNKAKTDFLSNMSHDIRTPMNAIIGFTNLALEDTSDEVKLKEYLTKIKASSEHLLSLINDVLEMSRIESGKIELEESVVSLPEIMTDLNTIIIGQVEDKHHKRYTGHGSRYGYYQADY